MRKDDCRDAKVRFVCLVLLLFSKVSTQVWFVCTGNRERKGGESDGGRGVREGGFWCLANNVDMHTL